MTEEEKKISKKESARKWREKNKEYIQNKSAEYYSKNKKLKVYKEKVLLSEEELILNRRLSSKKWREKNKEYQKSYAIENADKIKEYQKEYQNLNKEELNKKHYIRKKNRYNNNLDYRLKVNIRGLIVKAFKRNGFSKNSKTLDILGCSFDEFKQHLEDKFEYWMTWENKGLFNGELNYGWDIDHIIPLSSANTEEDIIRLNHYTNLQPMCSYINRNIKKDKLEYEII